MEVLIIGDLHLSGKNPPERIDDVTITQFEKVSEIVHGANEYDVPIICTGDIFHTPIVSNTILTKFGKIIKDLKREFYFVLGNHALQYHDINRIGHTSIGVTWNNNGKIEHIDMFHRKYRGYKWAYIDYGSDFNYGVEQSNANAAGGVMVQGWEQLYLRGVGLLRGIPDLERIVLK